MTALAQALTSIRHRPGRAFLTALGTALGIGTIVALLGFGILKFVMGIRVSEEEEREGLDLSQHGEEGYDWAH